MTTKLPALDLLSLIQELIDHCRRYDPAFDQRSPSYSGGPFQLSLHGVPEGEIALVAEGLGQLLSSPIDFGYGSGPPMVYTSCFITVGSLSVFLCSRRRPATREEVTAAVNDIHQRIVPGSMSGVPSTPTTTGDLR